MAGSQVGVIARRPIVIKRRPRPPRVRRRSRGPDLWLGQSFAPPRAREGAERIQLFAAIRRDRIVEAGAIGDRAELTRGRDLIDGIERGWLCGDRRLVREV